LRLRPRSIRADFRRSLSTPPIPKSDLAPRSTAAPARSRRARCGCSRRSASPTISPHPAARSQNPGRRRPRARRAEVRAGSRRRAAGLDAREPPSSRRAPRTCRGGPKLWLSVEVADRDRRPGRQRVVVRLDDGRKLSAPFSSPPTAAIRRRGRRRDPGRPLALRPQAIVSVLRHERRTRMSPMRFSTPAGPFALLPMTDDSAGHRSAIVWSVRKDDAPGCCRWAMRISPPRRGGDGRLSRQDIACRAALDLSAGLPPRGADHAADRLALVGDSATRSTRSPGRA
jgi:hypothetical protein